MKLTVYKCDNCKFVLSDDTSNVPHVDITIDFCSLASIDMKGLWRRNNQFSGHFQFCEVDCMKEFIVDKLNIRPCA